MTTAKLLEKYRRQKIGKKPMVVLPLEVWREIEDRLENLEIASSEVFKKKITKARTQKKLYSSLEVKKILGVK